MGQFTKCTMYNVHCQISNAINSMAKRTAQIHTHILKSIPLFNSKIVFSICVGNNNFLTIPSKKMMFWSTIQCNWNAERMKSLNPLHFSGVYTCVCVCFIYSSALLRDVFKWCMMTKFSFISVDVYLLVVQSRRHLCTDFLYRLTPK